MDNDKGVVKVEKRAVNKKGLFLLFIVVLAGLGYGGYYFVNNRDSFDFYFPWEEKTENKDNKGKSNSGFRKIKDVEVGKREINIDTGAFLANDNYYNISVVSASYDKDKGYVIKLRLENKDRDKVSFNIKNVIIDGYQLLGNRYQNNNMTNVTNFKLLAGKGGKVDTEIIIDNTFLDLYKITTIENIRIDGDFELNEEGEQSKSIELTTFDAPSDTSLGIIENINNIHNISYNYNKVVENKDSYNLYLLLDNTSSSDYTYYINKLLIDGKEYDASIYSNKIYSSSKYLEVINIPKNKYRNIKKIEISFMETDGFNNVYQTKLKEVDL